MQIMMRGINFELLQVIGDNERLERARKVIRKHDQMAFEVSKCDFLDMLQDTY